MSKDFLRGFHRGLAKLGCVLVFGVTGRWRQIPRQWRDIDTWRFPR